MKGSDTSFGERSSIDWPALLKRQQAANGAAAGGRSLSPEGTRLVLKGRAALLAVRPTQDADIRKILSDKRVVVHEEVT